MDTNHLDLAHEFPEFKAVIHELKIQDSHFAKQFSKYQELNRQIIRAEQRIELISEQAEEELRKERLQLKDLLYATLIKHNKE